MSDKDFMLSSKNVLPSYKKPPLNEVVCGLRFHTPEKLTLAHFGLFWDKFRKEYPVAQHAPPIQESPDQMLLDTATGLLLPRLWFINKADDQLVQFQLDRFYFNWRHRNEVYPRYSNVIKNFEFVVDTVDNFFKESGLGELKPVECELSYINHIPKGQGWDTIDDLPKIFSDFVWRQNRGRFLSNPFNIGWHADFPLPEKRNRLTVKLNQATRIDDKVSIFLLELTVKGSCEATNKEAIREWFDTAHIWIVRGFADLTTEEVQKSIWGREEDE